MIPDSFAIMPDTIIAFFSWLFSSVTSIFSFLLGIGEPTLVLAGFKIFPLDIILALLLSGVIVFYMSFKEKYEAIGAKREKRISEMYLRPSPAEVKNKRWDNISYMIRTPNPADWRVAIIECDSMLDDLFVRLGYPGSSLGERMKSANKANFPTIEDAWEAHKVRNQIAHAGNGFVLDQREALRVFYLYERVFRDAGYI